MMLDCWQFKSDMRPSFYILNEKLNQILDKYEKQRALLQQQLEMEILFENRPPQLKINTTTNASSTLSSVSSGIGSSSMASSIGGFNFPSLTSNQFGVKSSDKMAPELPKRLVDNLTMNSMSSGSSGNSNNTSHNDSLTAPSSTSLLSILNQANSILNRKSSLDKSIDPKQLPFSMGRC